MNTAYLEKYLRYYSGENRRAIYTAFATLVDAIRSGELEQLRGILTEDCIAEYSTCGTATGVNQIINLLAWPGPDCNVKRSTIWNFVARSNTQGVGQQSAYVQCIMAIDDGVNVFPFTFGGLYCNSFVKQDDVWKLSHIRFDLVYADGNTDFVAGTWPLVEAGKYSGHKPIIVPELDAPWYVIPDDCEPQTDAEQIFELQFKKTFGFDHGEFHLPLSVVTEDMQQFHEEAGNRNFVNFLKYKQHKETNLQHANRMGALTIHGDTAEALMPRGEDHRLRDRVYTLENIHSMVTTGSHKVYARKVDGVWKMERLDFGFVPNEDKRFIPLDDDVIAYDEYVLGERCDEHEDFH